jgi:hypothetical protein
MNMWGFPEIALDLPPTATLKWGPLCDTSSDPDWRDEDLVFIDLNNGYLIDVGYYGKYGYVVMLIKNGEVKDWRKPLHKIKTHKVQHAKKVVEDLARKYAS